MDSRELVHRLVDCLNRQHPATVFDIDVEIDAGARTPLEIETNPKFMPNPMASWPEDLVLQLPESLGYLVRAYSFPCVEIGPLLLFANTGGNTRRELTDLLVARDGWSPMIRSAGFLEIGKPADGRFDAVCLDARHSCHRQEYPLVRLDHEVLLDGKLPKPNRIAHSFESLAESIIGHRD